MITPMKRAFCCTPILDEAGNVINKEFAFRQPNGLKTLDGVRRVLYRLPEIVTRLDAPVLLCEGEKDADMLANLGYLATTSDAGAATWRLEYSESLRNRIVIVVIDHDKAGLERGRTLAPQLHAAGAKEVYTLDCFADEPVPDKHGKDVTDYFNAGATVDDFLTLITTGASF
jgi:putative DNA primase/helicase